MSRTKITAIAWTIPILIGYAGAGSAGAQVPAPISNPGMTRQGCAIAAAERTRCQKEMMTGAASADSKCEDGLQRQQRRCMLEVLERDRSDYRKSTGEQPGTPKN